MIPWDSQSLAISDPVCTHYSWTLIPSSRESVLDFLWLWPIEWCYQVASGYISDLFIPQGAWNHQVKNLLTIVERRMRCWGERKVTCRSTKVQIFTVNQHHGSSNYWTFLSISEFVQNENNTYFTLLWKSNKIIISYFKCIEHLLCVNHWGNNK